MPTAIELTLSSLVPTVSLLPLELIDLSTSLLAQSRSKAATLKPEEEIARTYTCCHIACQRLGHRLALEIAPPAPPVKPKVYKKLHAYFNSVLATPKQSRKRAAQELDAHEGTNNETRVSGGLTPSRSTAASGRITTQQNVTQSQPATKRAKRDAADIPSFVMPMIRHVCREFDAPAAASHVYAGVQSLMDFDNGSSPVTESLLTSKLVGVFDAVYGRLYASSHAKAKKKDHDRMQNAVRAFFDENRDSIALDREENGDTTVEAGPPPAECSMLESWAQMEWYQNLPSMDAHALESTDPDTDRNRPTSDYPYKTPLRREKRRNKQNLDGEEEVGAAGLLPGLGTMFQPAVDWLSDDRVVQYGQWKKGITKQLALLQQRV